MRIKKSQVSLEFLLLIGFVFMVSLGFILSASIQISNFTDEKNNEAIADFGNALKTELTLASVVHPGYYRKISLPEKINGKIEYTVEMKNSTIIIVAQKYYFNNIIPNTQGQLQKGNNIIRNQNGVVVIENT